MLGHSIADPAAYLPWVGSLIEAPAFYPALSGRRNLEILARLGGHDPGRVAGLLAQAELADRADDRFRSYSLGMKQRLGIAAALLPDPELLVLDEPTNGLDPAGIREVRVLLRALADQGLTILVSSHRLDEIQTVCEHLVIIDDGRIRFQGPIGALLEAQNAELIAVPEFAADVGRVAELARAAGFAVTVGDGRVHVAAPADWAPRLNAAATGAGINLAGLWTSHGTLEDAFFAITRDRDADTGSGASPAPARAPAPAPAPAAAPHPSWISPGGAPRHGRPTASAAAASRACSPANS